MTVVKGNGYIIEARLRQKAVSARFTVFKNGACIGAFDFAHEMPKEALDVWNMRTSSEATVYAD